MMTRLAATLVLLLLAGAAWAQVPPAGGSGTNGWLQAIYQQLGGSGGSIRTAITASATGTTAAVAATLAGVAGKTTFLCGLSVSPGSAAAAITIQVTTTGLTNNFTWAVGAPVTAAGVTGATLTQNFNPCVPASAVNTGIVVTSGALGTSGINNNVNSWGYQQ
jgi:hypothetical protein